jgi:NAD+ diphosphatase
MLLTPSGFDSAAFEHNANDTNVSLYFHRNELLVNEAGDAFGNGVDAKVLDTSLAIGRYEEEVYVAHRVVSEVAVANGYRFANLRSLFTTMPAAQLAIALRANQLLEWDRTHKHCGACGTATVRETAERARRCPACRLSVYPRISPAMMCLVTRGKEILLARNVNFPAGRYSALAGFLEAGESIEDAVHREVREEVGVQVKNLRYFASQSWPFPNSLMIAFTAEYAGGELTPNGHEIAEAGWFTPENLPQLPPRVSIARALIDETLATMHEGYRSDGQQSWAAPR